MVELSVNPTFRDAMIALTPSEFEMLEANILEDQKIYKPLIFWFDEKKNKRWIVDGHHRYQIAKKHNIPYTIEMREFDDDDAVIVWIKKHQLGGRNLTEQKYHYYLGSLYNAKRKTQGGDPRTRASEDTAQQIADEFDVGRSTVIRDAKFAADLDKITKNVRDAIINGELKATKPEVALLASAEAGVQQQVARQVRVGNAKDFSTALDAAGVKAEKKDKPKKKPKESPPVKEECFKGGDHEWESDGEGSRYCKKCHEDHPHNDKKLKQNINAKHLDGMTKTLDTLRLKIDELKNSIAKGDPLWKVALDGLDEARKAFAKLSRKA